MWDRRDMLEIAGECVGAIFAFEGVRSAYYATKALRRPSYRDNGSVGTIYEPAIQDIVENGKLDVKTVHMDYGEGSCTERLDSEAFNEGLEDILTELEGIDRVNSSYEFLDPEEAGYFPEDIEGIETYKVGELPSGLYSMMTRAGWNFRDKESQIVNLVAPDDGSGGAGRAYTSIEGVAWIEDSGSLQDKIGTAAHEDAHLLGIGHTLSDRMTNVPVGRVYSDYTGNFFGSKSQSWWNEILQEYRKSHKD